MKILKTMCRNIFEYRRRLLCLHPPEIPANYRCFSADSKSALRLLFFGTDHFSLPSLRILNENRKATNGTVRSLEVVTSFKAKKNPLKQYAQAEGLRLHDWPLRYSNVQQDFDLGIVVSFGHLIPEALISAFRLGMLNVHASLLPKLRGAAPIVHAIRNGDRQTGVTIMKIKPKHFDVGEILKQEKVAIPSNILMPELHSQLAQLGAETLVECVGNLDYYYNNLKLQDDSAATYAPKIDAKFAEVRWSELTAQQVYDLYRSLYSYKPLTTRFTSSSDETIKLFKLVYDDHVSVEDSSSKTVPGQVQYCRLRKRLRVWCYDGKSVEVEQLGIGGRKVLSAAEFYNGYLSKVKPAQRLFGTGMLGLSTKDTN
ncbi:methionyl-tRNA formyltransferase, mitochondrial [Wyeomyia smithii]|uniref:methionyl-tRNA formyltransferase, mitochondrial n=1 Tax=Wyeomyia smithii TaxID=174621 RepID=UPI0024681CCC|nr:methionyl-tRNA formyltransferase, mitochondrial [Wyeomyia smithii]